LESNHFGRHRVVYREIGSGPPLLLVHGLMTSNYSFRYVMTPLAQQFRVIAPDLVGAGRSDKPDARYPASALADWIAEFVTAMEIEGCAAIGNSLGGYLCMRTALAKPDTFSRLVNVHSPGVPMFRLHALAAGLSIPGAIAGLSWFVRRQPERFAHKHVHYFDETLKSREEAREYAAALASPEGARAFIRYLSDALSPRGMAEFTHELSERRAAGKPFPIPLCLVYARQDPMVPPAVGGKLAQLIVDARVIWLEDTSHFMHVDTPDPFLRAVEPFLRDRR
jgi:pimeloyl-ACP methyl ester carboxylesterase